jgi:hypothetical protein
MAGDRCLMMVMAMEDLGVAAGWFSNGEETRPHGLGGCDDDG